MEFRSNGAPCFRLTVIGRLWKDCFGPFTARPNRNIRRGELVMDVDLNGLVPLLLLLLLLYLPGSPTGSHISRHVHEPPQWPQQGSSTSSLPPPTQPPWLTPFALFSFANSDLDGCAGVAAVFQSPFSIILMLHCHFELYLASTPAGILCRRRQNEPRVILEEGKDGKEEKKREFQDTLCLVSFLLPNQIFLNHSLNFHQTYLRSCYWNQYS